MFGGDSRTGAPENGPVFIAVVRAARKHGCLDTLALGGHRFSRILCGCLSGDARRPITASAALVARVRSRLARARAGGGHDDRRGSSQVLYQTGTYDAPPVAGWHHWTTTYTTPGDQSHYVQDIYNAAGGVVAHFVV